MDRTKLTIILVSYFSFSHLKRLTKQLKKYEFIIIENSREKLVKEYFIKKKNIRVIFPKKNLGYGKGNNLGISLSKTNYCLILNPDTSFKEKNIQSIFNYIKKIDDFGILLLRQVIVFYRVLNIFYIHISISTDYLTFGSCDVKSSSSFSYRS
jgi:GT2 family glycosyltransferase